MSLGLTTSTKEYYCPVCANRGHRTDCSLGGFSIYQCGECGHHFAPDAFGLNVDYDAVYETSEYRVNQQQDILRLIDSPCSFAAHPTYRPFFTEVKNYQGARLLDVGCGVGRFCHAAHSLGWNVTGIDVSARAITLAEQHATFPVFRRDLDEVRQQGDTFDVITAFEVLEHLSSPVDFLRQCRILLSKRGQIFCTVPNWDCSLIQTATRIDWIPPIHLGFFSRSSLLTAITNAGFKVVKADLIWTDSFPAGLLPKARWIARRLRGTARHPLGIWVHAKV